MKYLLRTLDIGMLIIVTLLFTWIITLFYLFAFLWAFKKKKGYREEMANLYSGLFYNITQYRGFFETMWLNAH